MKRMIAPVFGVLLALLLIWIDSHADLVLDHLSVTENFALAFAAISAVYGIFLLALGIYARRHVVSDENVDARALVDCVYPSIAFWSAALPSIEAALLFVPVFFGRHTTRFSVASKTAVILTLVLVLLPLLIWAARKKWDLMDELARRVALDAAALGLLLFAIPLFVYGAISELGLAPAADPWGAFVLLLLCYSIAHFVLGWRRGLYKFDQLSGVSSDTSSSARRRSQGDTR